MMKCMFQELGTYDGMDFTVYAGRYKNQSIESFYVAPEIFSICVLQKELANLFTSHPLLRPRSTAWMSPSESYFCLTRDSGQHNTAQSYFSIDDD